MKKQYLFLLSLALVFSSCEKNFEVTDSGSLSGSQTTEMAEQDPGFLTSYVNGLYSWMVAYGGNHDCFGHASCLYNLDMMGLDIAINGTLNFGAFDINHDYGQYDWGRPYLFWNTYYTLIKKCNEVIDFFGEEDPENSTLKGYLGQAYALRAFSYYYLIQIFQDTVTGEGNSAVFNPTAPAVPIVYAVRDAKTEDEKMAHSGRNTLADLCEHIEFNLAKALPLLKGYDRGTDKNQVSYEVAQGIAARYYQLTQQWDKALEAATAAQNGFDLMDEARLKSGFMEINDSEVMWGFNHNTETSTVYASFFSHLSNDSPGYGGMAIQSVHCIDYSLYSQIPDSDYRKSLFNGAEGDETAVFGGGKLPYAARKFGYDPTWCQDYIYMRKAEMILICAEAHARLKDGSTATCLAELMRQRDPSWNKSTVTLDDVLLQRRIELWGEGFEYFDLRRNGLGVDRTYQGSNHLAINQYVFPAHSASWNFQIPIQEMQNNQYITEEEQNEWISGVPAE